MTSSCFWVLTTKAKTICLCFNLWLIFPWKWSLWNIKCVPTGHWGPGPLWNERRGACGREEIWGRRHREGESGHSGEDPEEPEAGPFKCKSFVRQCSSHWRISALYVYVCIIGCWQVIRFKWYTKAITLPKQDLKGLKNFNKWEYGVKVKMRCRAGLLSLECSNVTSFDFKTLKKSARLKLFLQCNTKWVLSLHSYFHTGVMIHV